MRSCRLRPALLAGLVATLAGTAGAAQKELFQTQHFAAAADKRVLVDAASLNVLVRSADIREVEVTTELRIGGVSEERASSWIARHTPTFDDSPRTLTIQARPGADGFMWLGHLTARATLRLALPPFCVPDITTSSGDVSIRGDFPGAQPLLLRTASGRVELLGAAASVDVRSASGEAVIEVVRPLDRLFARTASGDVTLRGGARTLQVDTASGDLRLENLSGAAEVETSTGKVFLQWDRLDSDSVVKVKTASGPVRLVFPEGLTARGYIKTTDGSIRSDLPGVVNEAGDTVLLQGSGPTLEVETASGDVIVGNAAGWPQPTPQAP